MDTTTASTTTASTITASEGTTASPIGRPTRSLDGAGHGELERATLTLVEAGIEFTVIEEMRSPVERPVAA